MRIHVFKYASPVLLYAIALLSFFASGIVIWLPIIYAWLLIPLLELLLKPDDKNMSAAEAELAKNDRIYDWLLYIIVPLQYLALICFLYNITYATPSEIDTVGKIMVMGLLCGTFGINVGHELGHRVDQTEQLLAKSLLLTSLYMHFFIEHNKGHHKRVATPHDPSSARRGEAVYGFYLRSIVFGFLSAWEIAARDVKKKGRRVVSLHNEMLQFQLIQILFIVVIYLLFGAWTIVFFLLAALQGILLLETVNYIEHYGLQRKEIATGKYERALPAHSWNSNHVIGRVTLFELSRHSDHHYLASRKYQVLRHHDHSPQMPTGYPGMMLLSLVPPAWFYVMNKRIKQLPSVLERDTSYGSSMDNKG